MKLWQYAIRRLIYVIPVLFGVCFLIFILFNFVGGNPALVMLGKHATPELIAELSEELGLNKPFLVRYLDVVKTAFTFDFGRSWNTKQEIWTMIKSGVGPSMSVSIPAFIIGTTISIGLSLLVAFYRGKWIDRAMVVTTIALMSISALAIILFCQWFFAFHLGWFEISGFEYSFPEILSYIALPVLIWSVLQVGPDLRFYRTIMLDEIYQDYVRTARAKGVSERKILFKHVLKNAMIPIVTYVVIQIPFLLLGALLLESFFTIPGLGRMTLDAVNNSDFPVLQAMTILISLGYILFTLITDLLYTVVDPRVRLQ